jgi:hypothetical protein
MPEQQSFTFSRTPVIKHCTSCGKEIIAQDFSKPGYVMSEFRNGNGECWDCDKKKRMVPA